MTLPSTVPGLAQDAACQAVRLAEGLTNAAVFVLMAMMYFEDKGRTTRVLRGTALARRKSITEPLRVAGVGLEDVLKGLDDRYFIQGSWGMRTIRCTETGDAVKHRFNTLRVFLRIHRAYPQLGAETVADVDILRQYMRKLCEGKPL